MSYLCPRCSSDNVQKLAVMYEAGTAGISTTTVGVGFGSGHRGGIAVAATEGTSQSLLAKKYAPPKPESVGGTVGCLIVLGLILAITLAAVFDSQLAFWTVAAFVGFLGFALVRQAAAHNEETYPKNRALWERRFICHRCGHIFEPTNATTNRPDVFESENVAPTLEHYSVRLLSVGDRPVAILQVIRDVTGLSILDAKRLADAVPTTVRSSMSHQEAQQLQQRFNAAGAGAELFEDDRPAASFSPVRPEQLASAHPPVDVPGRRCHDCGNAIFRLDGSCAHCESGRQRMPRWLIAAVVVFLMAGASFAASLLGGTQPKTPNSGASKSDLTSRSASSQASNRGPLGDLQSPSPLGAVPDASAAQPASPSSSPDASAETGVGTTSPDESVELVKRFYQALSGADGTAAATYVVPEKREQGPLSSTELTAKYSTLKTPLRLAEVWRGQNGLIDAHYSYTSQAGLNCLASSAVKLVSHSGDLFIDEVYVNEKCQ